VTAETLFLADAHTVALQVLLLRPARRVFLAGRQTNFSWITAHESLELTGKGIF